MKRKLVEIKHGVNWMIVKRFWLLENGMIEYRKGKAYGIAKASDWRFKEILSEDKNEN